jgi:hypothetical protein
MKILKICLFISVCGLFITGCTIDDTIAPITSPVSRIIILQIKNGTVPQPFVYPTATGLRVTLHSGTILNISPGAFQDSIGNDIKGDVNINVIEVLKKSEMFYAGLSTGTGTSLLESGGMLNITAVQGKKNLNLKPGYYYTALLPIKGTAYSDMQLFNGNTKNGRINWSLDTSTKLNAAPVYTDTTTQKNYYNLSATNLHWVNCDHFVNNPPMTSVNVILTNKDKFDETECFMIFEKNSAASLYADNTNKLFHYDNVPVGLKATVVTLAYIGTKSYASFVPVTITAGVNTSITLSAMDEETFDKNLKALD